MNKIANAENLICSVATMSRHPELYHYTKPAAFEGIIGSQTLWCSRDGGHRRSPADADLLQTRVQRSGDANGGIAGVERTTERMNQNALVLLGIEMAQVVHRRRLLLFTCPRVPDEATACKC